MPFRFIVLLLTLVLPGAAIMGISTSYLFVDWAALDASYQHYEQVVKSPSSTMRDLLVAEAAENRHRTNCFAERVGVLLGGTIAAMGIHGMFTLPSCQSRN